MAADIQLDEWLAEIDRLQRGTPGSKGQSVADMAAATGKAPEKIRQYIKAGIAKGQIAADFEFRPSISGRPAKVPVYRRVKAKGNSPRAGGRRP